MESYIKAAQQGDRDAFEWLLNQHYDSMFRFALKWCGNQADAEDITQQACIKLAKGISQYRFEAAFTSWLYRLVINCAKDWQKSQFRHESHIDSNESESVLMSGDTDSHTYFSADASVYLTQLLDQVSAMGEGFKETLLLVLGEGFSHKEAAAVLSVEEGTISWRIHKIRQQLSKQSQEDSPHVNV